MIRRQGPPASVRELYDRVADRYGEVVEVTRYGGRDWLAAALPAVADAGQVVPRATRSGAVPHHAMTRAEVHDLL